MKLMRLSALSQRLRRVARAHAAGESTLSEYRQARRVLLAELHRPAVRKLDDTHRRGEVASWLKQSAMGTSGFTGSKAATSSPSDRVSRWRLRWLVAALSALVAALWIMMRA